MRLRALLFALIALAGVGAAAYRIGAAAAAYVERATAAQVSEDLAAAGEDWARVEADGLIVTLTGAAPDEGRRLRAAEILRRVVDPARVRDETTLAAVRTAGAAAVRAGDPAQRRGDLADRPCAGGRRPDGDRRLRWPPPASPAPSTTCSRASRSPAPQGLGGRARLRSRGARRPAQRQDLGGAGPGRDHRAGRRRRSSGARSRPGSAPGGPKAWTSRSTSPRRSR